MTPDAAPAVLVLGATGKLGGLLRRAWKVAPPVGFVPLWQRRDAPRPGWCLWDPLSSAPMPRAAAVLMLSGVTEGPPEALAANTALALAVCNAAQGAGALHVLLASSAAVYGPTGADPVPETGPTAPARPYGAAKLDMERAALGWRQGRQGAPGVTCLRIGNVAGADMLAQAAASGRRVTLDRFADSGTADDGPVRSYIGPVTLARMLAALLQQAAAGARLPEVVNLAAPGGVAMADLLKAAGLRWGWQPAPPDAVARVVMDTALLGSLVRFDAEDGNPAQMVAQWRAMAPATAPRPQPAPEPETEPESEPETAAARGRAS